MVEHGIRHLPVVDGARRVVGVVSFDDLRAALPGAVSLRVPPGPEQRRADLDVPLAEVMTHAPSPWRSRPASSERGRGRRPAPPRRCTGRGEASPQVLRGIEPSASAGPAGSGASPGVSPRAAVSPLMSPPLIPISRSSESSRGACAR